LYGNGALRKDFLELAGGHQAAREGERAENHFQREHAHHELRNVRCAQIKFGGADQCDAQRAECVAEGGPLRHRGHGHAA